MGIDARWDADRRTLFVTFDGTLTSGDLLKYARRVTADETLPAGRNELADLRRLEAIDVESATLRRVATLFTDSDTAPEQARVAIVADSDVAYGLARMYQTFRSDSPLDLRVFREIDEARAWLELGPE